MIESKNKTGYKAPFPKWGEKNEKMVYTVDGKFSTG